MSIIRNTLIFSALMVVGKVVVDKMENLSTNKPTIKKKKNNIKKLTYSSKWGFVDATPDNMYQHWSIK